MVLNTLCFIIVTLAVRHNSAGIIHHDGDENLHNLIKEIQAENREIKLVLQNLEKVTMGMKIDMDSIREENAEIKSLCNLEHGRPSPYRKLYENAQNGRSHNVQVPFNNRSITHEKALDAQKKRLLQTTTTIENGTYVVCYLFINPGIAFSAALAHTVNLGQDQLVEYDKIVTNIGNGFDSRHSHFIAPVKGVYIFSACGFSQGSFASHLDIVTNGKAIGYLYTHADNMGTQVVVSILEKGDMVWVKHRHVYDSTGNAVIYGATAEQFVTFSGALLSKIDS
ncbi:C1QL [Mytilus edulis]|uniref:C1QL n=1 Tax=Mytilus edulis TaxID=6550 RepID=A0A8S3QWR2_MYTED|nr:C1QL [Mytilus edulis]